MVAVPLWYFHSDELLPYTSTDLYEKQYKFLQCVKTENKQTHISDDETENKQTIFLMMKQKINKPYF